MASNTVTSNKTHYARLGHATQNLLPRFLQEFLQSYENPAQIETKCKKEPFYSNRLKLVDKTKIGRASIKGNYEGFDIPLIYTILRNLHPSKLSPTKGWDQGDPKPNEIKPGDDIERCRRIRNNILHKGNTSVSDQELNDFFDNIRGIAQRLETVLNKQNNEFVSEVDELRTCCMDEDTEKRYFKEFQDLNQEMEDERKESQKKILKLEKKLIEANEENTNFKITKPLLVDIECVEGYPAIFECAISVEKYAARHQWFKDNVAIKSDEVRHQNVQLSHENEGSKIFLYTLKILKVMEIDAGIYKLELGQNKYECNLSVKERKPSLIKLRDYQWELAELALKGENTIVCAGTNSGKTYVALYVIEDHLLKHPKGKVAFMARTNVLVDQQYQTAKSLLLPDIFKGKIFKWDAQNDFDLTFSDQMKRANVLFLTPGSLLCYMDESRPPNDRIFIHEFSLLVFDECHHTYKKDNFNQVMYHFRQEKFSKKPRNIPQILGLTASPGTNKATTISGAEDHVKAIMTNLSVARLSVVQNNCNELLKWSSVPELEMIPEKKRETDLVREKLVEAMTYVEKILNCKTVTDFLLDNGRDDKVEKVNCVLMQVKDFERFGRGGLQYLQWIGEATKTVKQVVHINEQIARLLRTCLKHLKVYTECIEVNDLLDIKNVVSVIQERYGEQMYASQTANTKEERDVSDKMKDVYKSLRDLVGSVESNPDVDTIIERLNKEYEIQQEDSRFLIFVKTRMTAMRLAEKLPGYLNSVHLTGATISKELGGLSKNQQLETVDFFKNGTYRCIVATSVLHEGLDVPKCNLMIQYKFRANEISSYQMKGRVRAEDGKRIILASQADYRHEESNVKRQYLMKKAIDQITKCSHIELVKSEEKLTFEKETQERIDTKSQSRKRRLGKFTVRCSQCGRNITDGSNLRTIDGKHIVINDEEFLRGKLTHKQLEKNERTKIDDMCKKRKIFGPCNDHWGSVMEYHGREFACLSQRLVEVFDETSENVIPFKKWKKCEFQILPLTEKDVEANQNS